MTSSNESNPIRETHGVNHHPPLLKRLVRLSTARILAPLWAAAVGVSLREELTPVGLAVFATVAVALLCWWELRRLEEADAAALSGLCVAVVIARAELEDAEHWRITEERLRAAATTPVGARRRSMQTLPLVFPITWTDPPSIRDLGVDPAALAGASQSVAELNRWIDGFNRGAFDEKTADAVLLDLVTLRRCARISIELLINHGPLPEAHFRDPSADIIERHSAFIAHVEQRLGAPPVSPGTATRP